MKNSVFLLTALALILNLGMAGQPAAPQAATAAEAIETAKTINSTTEKVDYLITQGKNLLNSKKFQQAVDVAQYILRYLDRDSAGAKDLLQQAKDALSQKAQGAMTDLVDKIPSFGQ